MAEQMKDVVTVELQPETVRTAVREWLLDEDNTFQAKLIPLPDGSYQAVVELTRAQLDELIADYVEGNICELNVDATVLVTIEPTLHGPKAVLVQRR